MKKKWQYLSGAVFLGLTTLAVGENSAIPVSLSTDQSGFFIGLGASYNSVKTANQTSLTLNSISGVPPNEIFLGNAKNHDATHQNIAPEAQIGYFQHFNDDNWLWGLKFSYKYLQSNTRQRSIVTNLIGQNDSSINIVTVGSAKTWVNDELALLAFTGRSFCNKTIYLGVGPSLFRINNKISDISDTTSGYYIGNLDSFSNSQWLWGAAIQAGFTYDLNPGWFLDLNYTYIITNRHTINSTVAFSVSANNGLNNGSVSDSIAQRITSQEFAISLNKKF